MATIVVYRPTNAKYILLGTGYGAYRAERPSPIFGNLASSTTQGSQETVCICDGDGNIGWVNSSDVYVNSVDGLSVREAFVQSDVAEGIHPPATDSEAES